MSFWVYALYSQKHDKVYVGETTDVEDRFLSHNEKAAKGWTIQLSTMGDPLPGGMREPK